MKYLICVILLLSLSSCEHYYYVPNAHNVPLFKAKKEIRVSAAKSTCNCTTEIQAAYAVTDHLGVMANGFSVPHPESYKGNEGGGYLIEGGAGYFTTFNKHWIFENYAGYGAGNVHNIYFEPGEYDDEYLYAGRTVMNINRVFIQPSFGYTGNYFDLAFSSRFVGIWYTNIREYDITERFAYAQDMKLMRQNVFTQFEPAFTLRAGWKYVKVQFQYGLSMNINQPKFKYADGNSNLGIFLNYGKMFTHTKHAPRHRIVSPVNP